MKKHVLLLTALMISGTILAQDTITGWTFPVNSGPDSLNANMGLPGNLGYDIRFEGTDTTYNTIYVTNGASNFAATATGWDNGADAKFWSIKFKAENYTNFKVSSKQTSGGNNPGPRDFKLQWRLSGGTWEDIDGGEVTVANDWTTGVVTDLPVPVTNQGSGSIYIRWIMTSNTNSTGGTVEPTGIAKIDDILVTAVSTLGVTEILYTNGIALYPNPNNGTFHISAETPVQEISIYSMNGTKVYETLSPALSIQAQLDLPAGLYLVRVLYQGSERVNTTRMVVR